MDILEMLTKLVSFDSQSQVSNRSITDFICSLLLAAGFQQEDISVTSNGPPGIEKCNIIARKGKGENALMLAGHMDTMPAGNGWKTKPLELTLREGRLYGLGAVDMKAFLAAAIKTAEQFLAEQLTRPLVLVFTCDEEIGLLGAKHLKRDKLLAGIRYGIIGEPSGLCPARMHKGYIRAQAIVRGRSGHSSNPQKGINAIEKACQLIAALTAYRDGLKDYNNPGLEPPYPTLNIGAINAGGKETNRVPDECRLRFDIRPIPGQDVEEIVEDLKAMADKLGMVGDKPGAEIQLLSKPTWAMETPASSLIVQVAEKVTGKKAGSVPYSTEATVFNAAGLETVILGPGSIDQAHKPNEFVEQRYLNETVETLRQIVQQLCCFEGR